MDKFKRSIILGVSALVAVLYFWLSSRYPELNAKSLMAQSASVADSLSPWPLFQISESDAFYLKITLSTVNWINSNLKGMAFGLGLGAAFLTLFSYISLPDKPGRFRNTFYGFLLGTPLGVCVNCAAPVFKGILDSRRVEMAMATMLSSPTMNIVVLTMIFTLFPFYMAVIKIVFTLICIFIGIPLIAKFAEGKETQLNAQKTATWFNENVNRTCALEGDEKWTSAINNTIIDFSRNLYFISLRLIPLMLLAGLLGALLSHFMPSEIFEADVGFVEIVLAALFGVLLPVPIAFDVILVNAFYAQGLAEPIVIVLLCSLGIVSVFSMMVVWGSVSKQWALALMFFCFSLAVLTGLSAEKLHEQFYVKAKLSEFSSIKNEINGQVEVLSFTNIQNFDEKKEKIKFSVEQETTKEIVYSAPFFPKEQGSNSTFEHMEGYEIGLSQGFQYGIRDYTDPFWIGRGTAAGDYNQDGWPDLLFGSNQGFLLYNNIGGNFSLQKFSNDRIKKFQVFAVAFVDMDNDGWLDIFFTTFGQGNFVVRNVSGHMDFDHLQAIPNNQGLLTISPGFADIDKNGLLDIINGNMALGVVTGSNHISQQRNNSIVFNGGTEYRDIPLEKSSGETMSTLVSDVNNDGFMDIYFANDFIVPDKLLLGTSTGFNAKKGRQLLQNTPFFSMSADSADINNDLQLDLFTGGTTVVKETLGLDDIDGVSPENYAKFQGNTKTCLLIKDPAYQKNCLLIRESKYIDILDQKRNVDFSTCHNLTDDVKQQMCLLSVMWHLLTQNPKIFDCKSSFKNDERLEIACATLKHRGGRYSNSDLVNAIPQQDSNLLNIFNKHSKTFKTDKKFNHPGGWTWNGKIADFDNDGWQDVFTAEGAIRKSGYGWNVFMKNNQGMGFEQKQFSLGLVSEFGLFSYALVDFDNDGDLDIIGNSAEGPVQVYKNRLSDKNHSIAISLNDHQGNFRGIGARVSIVYDNGKKQQLREIKASGGYMSFDPAIAYFGVGKHTKIDKIIIRWPNHTISTFDASFSSGKHYRIVRK